MMSDVQESLTESFEAERHRLDGLHIEEPCCTDALEKLKGQAASLQAQNNLKQGLFFKLKRFLGQIAGLQDKEDKLLGEIEALEKKHADLKRQGKLRCAEAAPTPSLYHTDKDQDDEEPRDRDGLSLWSILGFLAFFGESRKEEKDGPRPS